MQVAAHLPEQGRGFELSLQPEELGRVRINLTASETGGTLLIQAERPETLDLMRRHAMQLAQELRALGHEALSLEFSHFGGSPQHGNPGGDATRPVLGHGTVPGTDVASDQGVINTLTLHAAPDHLDIRL